MSLLKYVRRRESTNRTLHLQDSVINHLKSRHLPSLFQEKEFSLGRSDKVFASQWLDERKVVCGTKSNQLFVLDMMSGSKISQPLLEGSPSSEMPEVNCGIHSIKINHESKLLATSGQNPNHLAVYSLPTFDPVCVGEGHSDWIFSVEWVDDFHLATDQENGKDKIRDLAYDQNFQTLISLSALGYVHLWDMTTCQTKRSFSLEHAEETVCLALESDAMLYAVGSQSHVSLYDVRSDKPVAIISSNDPGAGVRSLSFRNLLLTVGTGLGSLFFFDLRTGSFLKHSDNNEMICYRSGKGWLRDLGQFDFLLDHSQACCSNAIYTHCYDPTGTKLFAAGGPLSLILYGNYVALWE
ncbi:DDB1- and CUL4-associated factor 12-A [Acropora cervicornis]|uniref:DDB1- and CUL4-associated factor 12-A n=1 Tax=Acropora cervicornis TaxID=6130 RepID=A0AAD9Q1J5_ACRCE|nr:DDB1- and CUL4-associated factor 12-A [Acropora cervicornis]